MYLKRKIKADLKARSSTLEVISGNSSLNILGGW